jgi:hypothetical protein
MSPFLARIALPTGSMPAVLCVLLVAFALTACGGGGNTANSVPDDTTPPPASNNAPVISGSPVLRTIQDRAYTFTPTASDADGDTLRFSITNQPVWASFNSTDGTLSGTPEAIHIGTTLAVSISVSDDKATTSLAPFDLEVLPTAFGSATVSWDAPTTNADGSTLSDLAGFRVHYRTASGSITSTHPVDDPTATSAVVVDLEEGTYLFSVTAIDHSENESAPSPEVSKVIAP